MMPTGDVGGAELRLADGLSFLAKFDGDFGNGSQTSGGMGALRYNVVSSSQRSADQVWDEAFNQPCRSRRPLSAVGPRSGPNLGCIRSMMSMDRRRACFEHWWSKVSPSHGLRASEPLFAGDRNGWGLPLHKP
jgi:hypothetical protein